MRYRLPALIALAALMTGALVYLETGGLLRTVLVPAFLLVGPGAAFVPLLRLENNLHAFILSIALSLALDLLVATAAVYGGLWSQHLILSILIELCLIGVLCQVALGSSHTPLEQASTPQVEK